MKQSKTHQNYGSIHTYSAPKFQLNELCGISKASLLVLTLFLIVSCVFVVISVVDFKGYLDNEIICRESKSNFCTVDFVINETIGSFVFVFFLMFSIVDGTIHGNIFELYLGIFQGVIILLWSLYRVLTDSSIYSKILPISGIILECSLVLLVIPLRKEYSWKIFRFQRADADYQEIYSIYQAWLSFVKLDTSLGIIHAIFSQKGIFNIQIMDSLINWIAMLYFILFMVVGWICVHFELRIMSKLWVASNVLPLAFYGYSLYECSYRLAKIHPMEGWKLNKMYIILVTGGIGVFVHLLYCWLSYRVVSNFGKGLNTSGSLPKIRNRSAQSKIIEEESEEDPTILNHNQKEVEDFIHFRSHK
eukprot:TRINITY_DN5846_c0_g1_i1.p1 TRINITY_DN5846_c0_g1~~TRINITY_DN5846_c0_g1_i1.p1  ORF type:complete len:361 (-),score=49.37 TRINITY_DN5846_c0_g1_i1:11-1093(-)